MQENPRPTMSPSGYSRQKRLIELGVISFGFVLLPVLQGVLHSLNLTDSGPRTLGTPINALSFAWQLLLLFYLLGNSMPRLLRNKTYWQLNPTVILQGFALGLALLILAISVGYSLPHPSAEAMPFKRPSMWVGYIAIGFILIVAVMLEELLFRVYYLERLISLGANPYSAMLVAVPLFAIGHQYQGIAGILIATILGTILCLSWLRWHNYWLNCIAHLLYNTSILWLVFSRA